MQFGNGLRLKCPQVVGGVLTAVVTVALMGCAATPKSATGGGQGVSDLAPLPPVPIPADNPQTAEKIELGRMLFFDPRLAGDSSISCAKCHVPDQGFASALQL